jgi:hypothetical protein
MPGVNAFLKILLNGGAKIEVYSAHNHEGPYARRRGQQNSLVLRERGERCNGFSGA